MMYLLYPSQAGRLQEARSNGMKRPLVMARKCLRVTTVSAGLTRGMLNAILPCPTNFKAAKIGRINSGNREMQREDEFTKVISLV